MTLISTRCSPLGHLLRVVSLLRTDSEGMLDEDTNRPECAFYYSSRDAVFELGSHLNARSVFNPCFIWFHIAWMDGGILAA